MIGVTHKTAPVRSKDADSCMGDRIHDVNLVVQLIKKIRLNIIQSDGTQRYWYQYNYIPVIRPLLIWPSTPTHLLVD